MAPGAAQLGRGLLLALGTAPGALLRRPPTAQRLAPGAGPRAPRDLALLAPPGAGAHLGGLGLGGLAAGPADRAGRARRRPGRAARLLRLAAAAHDDRLRLAGSPADPRLAHLLLAGARVPARGGRRRARPHRADPGRRAGGRPGRAGQVLGGAPPAGAPRRGGARRPPPPPAARSPPLAGGRAGPGGGLAGALVERRARRHLLPLPHGRADDGRRRDPPQPARPGPLPRAAAALGRPLRAARGPAAQAPPGRGELRRPPPAPGAHRAGRLDRLLPGGLAHHHRHLLLERGGRAAALPGGGRGGPAAAAGRPRRLRPDSRRR